MRKKKRLTKISTPPSKDPLASSVQEDLASSFMSGGSLLNKYNQKKPSGKKKLSPASDEEME